MLIDFEIEGTLDRNNDCVIAGRENSNKWRSGGLYPVLDLATAFIPGRLGLNKNAVAFG